GRLLCRCLRHARFTDRAGRRGGCGTRGARRIAIPPRAGVSPGFRRLAAAAATLTPKKKPGEEFECGPVACQAPYHSPMLRLPALLLLLVVLLLLAGVATYAGFTAVEHGGGTTLPASSPAHAPAEGGEGARQPLAAAEPRSLRASSVAALPGLLVVVRDASTRQPVAGCELREPGEPGEP